MAESKVSGGDGDGGGGTATKIEAPSDDAPAPAAAKSKKRRKKIPARGNRKRVLGQGEGDYLVMLVAPPDMDVPAGTLLRLPDSPQFENSTDAARWVKQESGRFQTGQQIAIVRFLDIATLEIETQPRVKLKFKNKITVTRGQSPDDGDD